jgi:hypothetical protein
VNVAGRQPAMRYQVRIIPTAAVFKAARYWINGWAPRQDDLQRLSRHTSAPDNAQAFPTLLALGAVVRAR